MAIKNVAERALAYAIPSEIVDGNDVVAVYQAARNAYERARLGEGPSFIECKTMRMHGHSEHDAAKYVPRELIDEWKKKDPVINMESHLISNNIAKEEKLKEIGEQVVKEIEDAVEFAEQSPLPEGKEAIEGVYATPV